VRVLLLSFVIVLCDQITKLLVKGVEIPALGITWQGMPYGASRQILGDFFRLTYVENPGMAFSIDLGAKPVFALFSLLASVAIIVYLYAARRSPLGFRVALAMILGGAIGNFIDRMFYGVWFYSEPLFYGRVVDFFDVDFFDINLLGYQLNRWPVFNVADACVTVGVVLLLIFHSSGAPEFRSDGPAPGSPPSPPIP
jgi:signal peptidase II